MATEVAYQQCRKCVLDTTSTEIEFDEQGVCNYCHAFETQMNKFIRIDPAIKKRNLNQTINYIKRVGKGKKYDCILGLSGGVDSTYMAYLATQLGLRPMAIHFDNGWNSELAVKNIENIVSKLGLDLQTYVINWQDFKELQLAYLKSSVVDIEVPTDQLIFAALHKMAKENGIKYILSGSNIVTEYGVPPDWNYRNKQDQKNLMNIYKKFGSGRKLNSMPKFDFYQRFFYEKMYGIKTLSLLNDIEYNKESVKKVIINELNWKDYGGKHYESIFTRFYQGYILPVKFNIDKRKAHLSALICSGQIAKDVALKELNENPYTREMQEEDKKFVIKKLGLTEQEFQSIMEKTRVEQSVYGTEAEDKLMHALFGKLMYIPAKFMNYYFRLITRIKV